MYCPTCVWHKNHECGNILQSSQRLVLVVIRDFAELEPTLLTPLPRSKIIIIPYHISRIAAGLEQGELQSVMRGTALQDYVLRWCLPVGATAEKCADGCTRIAIALNNIHLSRNDGEVPTVYPLRLDVPILRPIDNTYPSASIIDQANQLGPIPLFPNHIKWGGINRMASPRTWNPYTYTKCWLF